jgi:hypothetical protein
MILTARAGKALPGEQRVLDKSHKGMYFLNTEAMSEESRTCRDYRELAAGASQYQGQSEAPS